MATFRMRKVATLPSEFLPNTLYVVPLSDNKMRMFMSSADGLAIRALESAGDPILTSEEEPPTNIPQSFWFKASTGELYLKRVTQDGSDWVLPLGTNVQIPEFAGNGEATTMARSDHWHAAIRVVGPQW